MMNSIKSEIPKQNISDAIEDINKGMARVVVKRARLAAMVCGIMLALASVALAQIGERSRTRGTANSTRYSGNVYTGMIETAYGPRKVTYQILKAAESGLTEDLALFEGDIVLTNIGKVNKGVKADTHESVGRSDTRFRWPGGVIPYEIDSAYSAAERQIINDAINHWNSVTPYWLRPRQAALWPFVDPDYIRFVRTTGVCSSPVGRQGGRQDINLDAVPCGTGGAVHEIGHSVGLWHEQSRADRNNFVMINWANIQAGMAFNFQTYIQQGQDGQDMFDYDFNSIMHYSSFAFSANNQPTITRLDGTLINVNRTTLSDGDIAGAVRVLTKNGPATFKLVNAGNGQCLMLFRNVPSIYYSPCNGSANQRWYFWTVPGTNSAVVINDLTGKCLDMPNGSLADGETVQHFSCHGSSNQRFRSFPQLRNENSMKCLEPSRAGFPQHVKQYTCHSGSIQKWNIQW